MIKLVLSIRSLGVGGAERQFIQLVKHIDKKKFDVTVCTMYGGAQEETLKQIPEIRYYNLNKSGRYDFYTFFKNYSKFLQEIQPDVIYSFLGEMNLFSLWCKPKETKIIWGLRASNVDFKKYGNVSQLLFWFQKKLSHKVDKIIVNSKASIAFHKQNNFDMSTSVVIQNGIDVDTFKQNNTKREEFRKKYQLKEDDIAIGIVARIDYMKGYTIFSTTAKRILNEYENIYFFAIGSGDESIKKECKAILAEHNNHFFWLGSHNRVQDIYSGLDISVSSSFGEGFSNSIAEAMSCELPCVVTDVGDSKIIVGDIGVTVKPYSSDFLYIGLKTMLASHYHEIGILSRQRIIENFSIEKMVKKTEGELYGL